MSYEQFACEIEKKLKECIGGRGKIHLHTVIKNNGKKKMGITFLETDVNISPTIYLEEYYQQFLKGETIEEILFQMLKLYKEVRAEHSWDNGYIECYETVRKNIIYHLVNKEKNKERLKEIPYIPYLEFAVIFQVVIDLNEREGRIATMLVRNEHLSWWKVTAEELLHEAKRNTEKLLPYEFSTMYAVISEIMEKKQEKKEMMDDDMYVLTNSFRNHGAAAVLYEGRLERIGDYLGENYYLLPSSIHEVIIIPESKSPNAEELGMIIEDMNTTQVDEEEVLSDKPYYYDRIKNELL